MSNIVRIWGPDGPEPLRDETVRVLGGGKLVAFPTDTVYGIGGRYDLPETDGRLRAAKGSDDKRPFQVLVADEDAVARFINEMPPVAAALAEVYWPGPLTIVMESREGDFVGLRRPDHPVALFVVRCAGGALLASSANLSGRPPAKSANEAVCVFGERVALAFDGGPPGGGAASSVVKVRQDGWELLREEAVSCSDLAQAADCAPCSLLS